MRHENGRVRRLGGEVSRQNSRIGRLSPGDLQPFDVGAEGLGNAGESVSKASDDDHQHAVAG